MEPKPLGAVLAMLVDAAGKPVRDGAAKGQLYVSPQGLTVLRPTLREELFHRVATVLLVGSVLAVVANWITLRSMTVVWIAIGAQLLYWVTLSPRRRLLDPVPLSAAALEEAQRRGRAAIAVPAGDVLRVAPPRPPERGFRRPARFELAEGALEIYLSEGQFEEARAALGR